MAAKFLELCFKGKRDYLTGADMYDALAGLAETDLAAPVGRFHLSIHRFARAQCRVEYGRPHELASRPSVRVADFSAIGNGRSISGWLLETDVPVTCRVPYEEERIARLALLQGNAIEMGGESGCSPIEVVVALTKELHNRLLPALQGRWIFTKLDLHRLLARADADRVRIALEQDLHGRLTRSQLVSAGEQLGSIYFSLVK